jgi:hypothetical protein
MSDVARALIITGSERASRLLTDAETYAPWVIDESLRALTLAQLAEA